jgi:glycosyltransferase involved in cell wall biosynthesis
MKPQRTLFILFAGSFEDSALAARLKIVGEGLKDTGLKIRFVSQFPGRQLRTVNQDNLVYLSFHPKNSDKIVSRIFKVGLGHFCLINYLLFYVKQNDMVYYYNPMLRTTLSSLLLAKLLSKRVLIDKTELFQHEKNTWYNRLGDKWAFKYATIPFAISDRLIAYGQLHTNKPIIKLPIVVDFKRFDVKIKPEKKLIGYVGTSAAKDGLDMVLKGFALALKGNTELRLRVIGSKPTFFDFDKTIIDLGIQKNVELTGSKSFEEVPQLLLECDTFIMNRDNSLFAQYGYPTKLGEYFACNRPVLMSDGPGFAEDFSDKVEAIKYSVNEPESLSNAIGWRYQNQEEATKIANTGYLYAKQHFSSEVVTSILLNTLKD